MCVLFRLQFSYEIILGKSHSFLCWGQNSLRRNCNAKFALCYHKTEAETIQLISIILVNCPLVFERVKAGDHNLQVYFCYWIGTRCWLLSANATKVDVLETNAKVSLETRILWMFVSTFHSIKFPAWNRKSKSFIFSSSFPKIFWAKTWRWRAKRTTPPSSSRS